MIKKIRYCPVFKRKCALYDQSSSGRCWCDNEGDPNEYERCPIPKKRHKANMKEGIRITEKCEACGTEPGPAGLVKNRGMLVCEFCEVPEPKKKEKKK